MVRRIPAGDFDVIVKFGGGLHTRAPEDEIGEREAAGGRNFLIDVQNSDLRPRPPFDLLGTAPNAGSINGGGSFIDANGDVKAFFQAGDTVYDWDGESFDASPVLDTVNANAKLRGHWRSHNWELDNKLLISDLALLEVVKEWDGTTWQDVSFLSNPSTSFGNFFCKYISIAAERAIYSHIKDAGGTFGHLMVGSKRSDYQTISVDDRPSTSLSDEDAFFLPTPDLRKINGFIEAFASRILSTEKGRIFNLTGDSAQNFALDEFYPGSAASGDESLAYIGNDVIYGRQGRIESVRDTDRFGDTEADDITINIADQVKGYTGWRTVYNSRINRVYLFPADISELWAFDTVMRAGPVSPWMRWRTSHSLAFRPTFVMSMLDPSDGLEYVFMGDGSGNVYRLEGTGANGDGGTESLKTVWRSRLFSMQLDARLHEVEGYIKYRKGVETMVDITLEYAGENVFDSTISVLIPEAQDVSYYMDGRYYNNNDHYGVAFRNRLVRQRIEIPGGDTNEFQIVVSVTGTSSFDINEIGLRFRGAS